MKKKYIITLWVSYFDYDGLCNDFKVLGVYYDRKEAEQKLPLLANKIIGDSIIEGENRYTEMEVPENKLHESYEKIYAPPNVYNMVVGKILRATCSKSLPEYNKNYFALEIIEIDENTEVNEKLFNPEKCKFEVKGWFDEHPQN